MAVAPVFLIRAAATGLATRAEAGLRTALRWPQNVEPFIPFTRAFEDRFAQNIKLRSEKAKDGYEVLESINTTLKSELLPAMTRLLDEEARCFELRRGAMAYLIIFMCVTVMASVVIGWALLAFTAGQRNATINAQSGGSTSESVAVFAGMCVGLALLVVMYESVRARWLKFMPSLGWRYNSITLMAGWTVVCFIILSFVAGSDWLQVESTRASFSIGVAFGYGVVLFAALATFSIFYAIVTMVDAICSSHYTMSLDAEVFRKLLDLCKVTQVPYDDFITDSVQNDLLSDLESLASVLERPDRGRPRMDRATKATLRLAGQGMAARVRELKLAVLMPLPNTHDWLKGYLADLVEIVARGHWGIFPTAEAVDIPKRVIVGSYIQRAWSSIFACVVAGVAVWQRAQFSAWLPVPFDAVLLTVLVLWALVSVLEAFDPRVTNKVELFKAAVSIAKPGDKTH